MLAVQLTDFTNENTIDLWNDFGKNGTDYRD
jgi:hypothetical protein